MRATLPLLKDTDFPPLRRKHLETLQVNVGYRCDLACLHCHVNAGPTRKEEMDAETANIVVDYLQAFGINNLDLTGGAPEMNAQFRHLVTAAHQLGVHVIDRSNLTILETPEQADLAEFLASYQVEIVASLPCYTEQNVDGQRGKGVFNASIRALQKLNGLGYGLADSGLVLNLVYNPQGPSLPPPQGTLEDDYRDHLKDDYGIVFNHLHTITNMPIKRFGSILISRGQFDDYMNLLRNAYVERNLEDVMCRSLVSVDWRGYVYDCDFNQQLDMPLGATDKPRIHLAELFDIDLEGQPIAIADHCYGCTAGQGSSCGGALND